MRVSINGIDKSGKTTVARYVAGFLLSRNQDVEIAPSLRNYTNLSCREYDQMCSRLPRERVVVYERSLSRQRNEFMALHPHRTWVLDRGDLTIFVNLITHLMYDGLTFEQAHKRLGELLDEPIESSDDIGIYMNLPIGLAMDRGLHEEGRSSQVEFLEKTFPVYNSFVSRNPNGLYIVDAAKPLDKVLGKVEKIIGDL